MEPHEVSPYLGHMMWPWVEHSLLSLTEGYAMATYQQPKPRKGLDHRAYRRATARLRANSSVCWICGLQIDLDLPYTDAMSFTADHVVPRSKGGSLLGELKAAHRSCNSKRGNRAQTDADRMPTTRNW